jgi:hypothetical protein
MSDMSLWGVDLTRVDGFYDLVIKNVEAIKNKEDLL